MTAIDSSIILPPQAKAPQNSGMARKGGESAEKTGQSQKEFTTALTETPPKKEAAPAETEQSAPTAKEKSVPQITETVKPEQLKDTETRSDHIKGKAVAILLEKLAQRTDTEIDPGLLEKVQAGDMEALKEILLSLGIEAEPSDLENIAADATQGQIVAVLAQLLQQQQTAVTGAPRQTPPAALPPLSQGAALLLAQEDQQQMQQAAQPKDGDAAVKEQPRPAPQLVSTQTQQPQPQPQQQVQQQNNMSQQQANNNLQTGTNTFSDSNGFTGGGSDGGFPQQSSGTQTSPEGQFPAGQDGRSGQQALPQFAAAKAAGSFQSPAMHKVFLTMQRNAAERVQQVTLQLEPAAMGRVAVTMIFGKDGSMKAHLLVEKQETYQMLSRDSHALEKALKEAGLDLGDNALSFDLSSGQDQFEKAETQQDSGQGFHFYMHGENGEMTAAEQARGIMNAAHANDYALKKGSINIVI